MRFEAVQKIMLVTSLLFFVTGAQAQCNCGEQPYIEYDIPDYGFELYDVPWEVVSIVEKFDMTQDGEPLRCFIKIDVVDWEVAGKFAEVPAGEFALFDGMQWHVSSAFEAAITTNGCSNQHLF